MSEQFLQRSVNVTPLLDGFNRIRLCFKFRVSPCESFANTAELASLNFVVACRERASKEAAGSAAKLWRHHGVLVFEAEKLSNKVVAHGVIVPKREEKCQANIDENHNSTNICQQVD